MKQLMRNMLLVAATSAVVALVYAGGIVIFDRLIERYVLTHGDIVLQALKNNSARQDVVKTKGLEELLASNRRGELFDVPLDGVGGNTNGNQVLVEFFDVNCLYCRKLAGTVAKLEAENKDVKVIYKQYPILGESSVLGAKAMVAAGLQGKFEEFYRAIMSRDAQSGSEPDPLTSDEIEAAARSVGIDLTRFARDMHSPSVEKNIEASRKLGRELELSGTPTLIVGKQVKVGALAYDDLARMVAAGG